MHLFKKCKAQRKINALAEQVDKLQARVMVLETFVKRVQGLAEANAVVPEQLAPAVSTAERLNNILNNGNSIMEGSKLATWRAAATAGHNTKQLAIKMARAGVAPIADQ